MESIGKRSEIRAKRMAVLSFSLFFSWIMIFPFDGQILQRLTSEQGLDGSSLMMLGIAGQGLGLLSGGFLLNTAGRAAKLLPYAILSCLVGTLLFFSGSIAVMLGVMAITSFIAGLYVAGFSYYLRKLFSAEERFRALADVLICSNLLMIGVNIASAHTTAAAGVILAALLLGAALFLSLRMGGVTTSLIRHGAAAGGVVGDFSVLWRPAALLGLFILVLTLNSGLMYRVVVPSFGHHGLLTSYYWAVPYIAAIWILKSLPPRINQAYFLYCAMVMIGVSYLGFMALDRSVTSYLLIDTLMLGAFGVCDLFFWSVLTGLTDYTKNAAMVFGLGLSMNVGGILLGGFVGDRLMAGDDPAFTASLMALAVVLAAMLILPALLTELSRLLKAHIFLIQFSELTPEEQAASLTVNPLESQLTDKEQEIVMLLLKGYTYKAMAEELYISENTVKYHVKNIYNKTGVGNKMELIRQFSDSQ